LAGSGLGSIQKFGPPYLFLQPLKLATSKFGTQLWFGTSLPKTTFKTKIGRGLGQGSNRENLGRPYLFLQPLKLATEKLVHTMSSDLPCQTQVLAPS